MDRSLDEVIADRQSGMNRGRRNPRRNEWPREGVKKYSKDDRGDPDQWVHDRYEGDPDNRRSYRGSQSRRQNRTSPENEDAKLRVDNLHYDLTEDDLEDLFTRIGPINSLQLRYDRAGRSEGTAYVTYGRLSDARLAIREFDGANAKGQPIRLSLMPTGPAASRSAPVSRNPFDTARMPAKSLFERVSAPGRRSVSPVSDEYEDYGSRPRRGGGARGEPVTRRSDVSKPPPDNIDRYVPGQRSRSRSPPRRRRGEGGGRRPGEGRNGSGRGARGDRDGDTRRTMNGRPRKTQEELDKEMEDYWTAPADNNTDANALGGMANTSGAGNLGFGTQNASNVPVDEDVDMIE